MATKYPPYVNGYGNVPKLFKAIKEASVPPKFTNNFMQTALGLKSTSFRAMIPLLKRLGFIDPGNVPTEAYKQFRDDGMAGAVMEERLKAAYADLFNANEYAYKLKKDELQSKFRTLSGAAADDKIIPLVAGTFLELSKLASFDGEAKKSLKGPAPAKESERQADTSDVARTHPPAKLGLSYTINLNLPATTEIQVFNAIFKSLREHILNER